jgi:hypothetical protein
MINSSLHRIDWGKVIHKGVVVPCRVCHYSTLQHLTISGMHINLLSFAGRYLGSTTTLPHVFGHAEYYCYVTHVPEELTNFYAYALMPISTHEETCAGTKTQVYTIKI